MNRTTMMLAMLLALTLSLTAVPAMAERGVTDDTVKIAQWGPQTGPAALWGSVARGTKCYFKMINEDGGINGRKIDFIMRDDGYQPNKTKAIAKELVEKEGVFMFVCGVGTAPGYAVMPYLVEKNVPWVGMTTGAKGFSEPPKKTIFAVWPLYSDEAKILTRYAIDKMGKKKIGFLYQNDDYGKSGLEGAEAELASRGMKLAASVPLEITDTDLQSHVLLLKQAQCDAVIIWLLPKQAAIVLKDAAKMRFKPQWLATSTLSDYELMYKITRGLWKGVICGNFAQLPDSDHPLMVKYREAWKKHAPGERWGAFFYAGFSFAEPAVEGLKMAGKDLTVDSFVKAMESMKDFQGTMGKVGFGPNQRLGMHEIFLAECIQGGKAKRISDWISVDSK